MKRGFIAFFVLCFVYQVHSTTYYVSNAGNNANSGTSVAQAFATLQHATTVVASGDSVIVLAGDYAGFNLNGPDGAPGDRIVFLAQGVVNIVSPASTTDGINIENSDWIEINGFTVNDQPRNGIRLALAANCVVRNCICDNNFERGIFTGFTDDLILENNICSNSIDEHGIYVSNSSDRSIIRYNTCFGNAGAGIQINADASQGGDGTSSDPQIYGNVIYENGTSGGAAINLDGVQGAFIFNNLLYENHATGIALFQIDGATPSLNATIIHNTIVNASDGRWCILFVDGSTGGQVYNNILFNQHAFRGSMSLEPADTVGFDSDYNMVIDRLSNQGDGTSVSLAVWQSFGYDAHSFLSGPLNSEFESPALGDFHLAQASQAINSGSQVFAFGVGEDLEGIVRPQGAEHDIGGFEYDGIVLALDEESGEKQEITSRVENITVTNANGLLSFEGLPDGSLVRMASIAGVTIGGVPAIQGKATVELRGLIPGHYIWTATRNGLLLRSGVIVVARA